MSNNDVFIELFIAILVAFVVLLFSQFILRDIFRIYRFTFVSISVWFLFEAALVATSWFFLDLVEKGIQKSFVIDWLDNFFGYILIMFIPYFSFISFIQIKDLLKEKNQVLEENINSDNSLIDISFKDESGSVKLIIKLINLIYLQSSDNYVEIYYLENGNIEKSLLRNSIKNLEPLFFNTSFIRCHRSFMINTSKIEVARKTSSGFDLKLKHFPDVVIPVSKSFSSEIRKFI
jgi:hypothetical protein